MPPPKLKQFSEYPYNSSSPLIQICLVFLLRENKKEFLSPDIISYLLCNLKSVYPPNKILCSLLIIIIIFFILSQFI